MRHVCSLCKVACLRTLPTFYRLSLRNAVSRTLKLQQPLTRNTSQACNSFCQRSHTCGELRASHIGEPVTLYGWVQYKRFDFMLTLKDAYGITQIVAANTQNCISSVLSKIRSESVIKITGKVQPRQNEQINKEMLTGEIEVLAEDIELISECKDKLPFQPKDHAKVKESLRMQYRYLDIRTSKMQENLRLRSRIAMKMREFLCNHHGFVEVETPTMFKQTPGGSQEFVIPTRHPERFYCLPQSPQQFKQLLMVGGLDRYFQFARCYRDEGTKPDRQPEFTQVDLEMSFVNRENIYSLVEGMIEYSWPSNKTNLTLPFPKMTYADAIAKYGTDKPDTRFDMKLHDVSDIFINSGLSIFDDALKSTEGTVQAIAIRPHTHITNRDLENLQKLAKTRSEHGVIFIQVKDETTWRSPISKYLKDDMKNRLGDLLHMKPGDVILLAAGKYLSTCLLLGHMRIAVADLLETKGVNVRKTRSNAFVWVEDFPLFLPKENGKCESQTVELESAHHPFTAPHPEDAEFIYTKPDKVRSLHYDLVYNGAEIAGGSIRIHDAKLQKYVLDEILKEDSSSLYHLLEALESGAPTHGGIAIGFDRYISMLRGTQSIRDVIAFPKSWEGNDLMSGAPTKLTNEDIKDYHIEIQKKKS
ncbi:aspartate--tRNA ligase, mitochondrial-like [Saccoglossus kowalevskii]|uniref:Aspartate--tRNA ligase, mitochondrial-like n=1 Tax=Saccoglossus kowalevskii TaxID=10224 RepID=A0ABM0MU40_SACKO|nr:PREDICTED: aspartate--tRNA ligase, mitochondrial-like [Saccoglossus kowalevskii]